MSPDPEVPASPAPEAAPLQHRPDALADLAARARFLDALRDSLASETFVRLLLGKPVAAQAGDLQRVTARRLEIRGEDCLSLLYRHATKDITKNEPVARACDTIDALVGGPFMHAHLFTTTHEWQLMRSRKGRYAMHRAKAAGIAPARGELPDAPLPDDDEPLDNDGGTGADATMATGRTTASLVAPESHDRQKQRWIDLAAPFLAALGVTDGRGRLVPTMARKWKQINKFVEVTAHALERARLGPDAPLNVVDFGAGKGYLTFGLHDWLRRQAGGRPRALDVVGVELREDLVRFCNDAVARLGLDGLRFAHGDVSSFVPERLDIMIALHACDTATDHALHVGIRGGASIIMCSPCCHKQLRPQMQSPDLLSPMLKHGIHLGQQAEMVTDALRALLLESEGYDAQVFEFVALEHTSKNKMILAVRRGGDAGSPAARARADELRRQIAEIKAFYGVKAQCLETLLAGSAPASTSPKEEGTAQSTR
jgi:hypothetical protein